MNAFIRLLADDHAATMTEYALILTLIAVVCIVVVLSIGQAVSSLMFQQIANSL